jgi:hypothetical protein
MSSTPDKKDCIRVREAVTRLGISEAAFYNYINYLGIQTHRFRFDRFSYITFADFSRLEEFVQSNA